MCPPATVQWSATSTAPMSSATRRQADRRPHITSSAVDVNSEAVSALLSTASGATVEDPSLK